MEDNVSIAPTQTCTTTSHSHQLALATTIPEIPETAPGLLPTIPHLLIRPSSPPPSIVLFIHPSANHTAHIPIIGGLLRHQRRAATGLAAAASGTTPPHTTGKILAHFSVTSNLQSLLSPTRSPSSRRSNSPIHPCLSSLSCSSWPRLPCFVSRRAPSVRPPSFELPKCPGSGCSRPRLLWLSTAPASAPLRCACLVPTRMRHMRNSLLGMPLHTTISGNKPLERSF